MGVGHVAAGMRYSGRPGSTPTPPVKGDGVSADIAGWTPAFERRFKELLYRFLEDVQATKAALYLLADDGSYVLATQYGFGRRDLLAAEHLPEDPMVVLVRQLRSVPRAFNGPDEVPELARYLEGAGTARLLLVPLFAASRIFGFIDVRDKGRRRKFTPPDVTTAGAIAADMMAALRETNLYPELVATAVQEPVLPGPPGEVPQILMDESGLDREALAALLGDAASLAACPGVHAVAVTQWEGERCQTVVLASSELLDEGAAALRRHQADELRRHGWPVPADEAWELLVRRVEAVAPADGHTIATSGLPGRPGVPLVISVVAGKAGEARRHLAVALRRAEEHARTSELRFSRRRMVRKLLATPGDEMDPLRRHGEQVSRVSWNLGHVLDLPGGELEEVALAGLVHDIGMPEILGDAPYRNPHPGPEERHMYRRHAQAGERRLLDLGLRSLASIVRHHHERWDGGGYPDRLAGEAIPLTARIVHVAEVYDVLTSTSSYRRTVAPQRALAILKAAAGQQFDPRVVRALEQVLP